ncbi:MAG: class B sortase [Clostridia bacterium]|nr:class B sortase [Clostridia bacterium]
MTIGRRFKERERNKEKHATKSSIIKRTVFIRFIQLILIICMMWSLIYIIKWLKENRKSNQIKSNIDKSVTMDENNKYTVDFDALINLNKDVVAWLKVNNTNIEYPVVQADNNDYYLYHSFDRTENGAGWIFLDYRNKIEGKDKNIVIYGHNRKDGSMFGTLNKVLQKEWYQNKDNQTIKLITKNGEMNYQIFSVYQIENEEYYIKTSFNNNLEFKDFLEKIKSRSIYNFETETDENSQILTLSTCGASNKYRVVVHAKKIND